jgi:hypothetical protein
LSCAGGQKPQFLGQKFLSNAQIMIKRKVSFSELSTKCKIIFGAYIKWSQIALIKLISVCVCASGYLKHSVLDRAFSSFCYSSLRINRKCTPMCLKKIGIGVTSQGRGIHIYTTSILTIISTTITRFVLLLFAYIYKLAAPSLRTTFWSIYIVYAHWSVYRKEKTLRAKTFCSFRKRQYRWI